MKKELRNNVNLTKFKTQVWSLLWFLILSECWISSFIPESLRCFSLERSRPAMRAMLGGQQRQLQNSAVNCSDLEAASSPRAGGGGAGPGRLPSWLRSWGLIGYGQEKGDVLLVSKIPLVHFKQILVTQKQIKVKARHSPLLKRGQWRVRGSTTRCCFWVCLQLHWCSKVQLH